MEDAVYLKITHCRNCPSLDTGYSYSLDGFDHGNDWVCKRTKRKKKNAQIAGFVERKSEEDRIKIPAWCPLRKRD